MSGSFNHTTNKKLVMNEIIILVLTALSLGFAHTILGPDHYLPFIVISKARKWSLAKTMFVTFISGLGHVAGSVVIGLIGFGFGFGLQSIVNLESSRGEWAAWMIIGFGIVYSLYGIWKARQKNIHSHLVSMEDGSYKIDSSHSHSRKKTLKELTPWLLFVLFVFGPCEVLIPMLIFPAVQSSAIGAIFVISAFAFATVGTMMVMVFTGYKGLSFFNSEKLQPYFHLLAGLTILLSGLGIQFLGL